MVLEAIRQMTVAEYLAFELDSEIKHEYIDGEIYPMPGVTKKHDDIVINCIVALSNLLRSSRCRVSSSDMRVSVSPTRYVYPDFSVICGIAETEHNTMTFLNPTLVAEVTSPSSIAYDRDLKREFYQSIDTLQHYLVIDQHRVMVDLYTRGADGSWRSRQFADIAASLPLAALGCELPLAEIYRRIKF